MAKPKKDKQPGVSGYMKKKKNVTDALDKVFNHTEPKPKKKKK